jgi:light-regulated signal transduction histidine kinase (bacteriophytochrome)
MGRLIDDLLALGRVSRQEMKLAVTGLGPLVEEVIRSLKSETKNRNIQWNVGQLPFAECDPGLIKVVFVNLLSNAVKYSGPRDPAIIEVGHTTQNGERVIYVRDNGVGFNEKYASKLFGIFQRLHRQEDFEGTGVGLATVQRILNRHHGRIWAKSEVEKGSTFYFTTGGSDKDEDTLQHVLTAKGES